jgi:chromate reductase
MAEPITILGISGSLRDESYNTATLRAATKLVPEGARIVTFDRLREFPPFDQDQEQNPPAVVTEFKEQIRAADAILFVTPEYNYSVPGVLKNAIDWASRPYGDNAWAGKPVAVMGASIGMIGSARAQYHLRQSFVFLDMHAVNQPEVMIPFAGDKFNHEGELTDSMAKDLIRQLLDNLVRFAQKFQAAA